jgi:hypothetical protein
MVFTCIVMVVLAFLGYSSPLPLNDKLQHFLCFSIATGIFYFIFDVDECVVLLYSAETRDKTEYYLGMRGGYGSGDIPA